MTCPFCDTRIADAVFARSEDFLAVYNIAPIFPGHSIIIPRNHIETIMELDDEMLTEMMVFSRKVTKLLLRVFKTDSFNWSLQDKEAAGQTIAHLHMHIVPRMTGDIADPGDWYPKIMQNYEEILDSASRAKLTSDEMRRIVAKLRKEYSMDHSDQ